MASLLELPDELLLKILLLLNPEFLLNVVAILNSRFYYLTQDSSLWATFKVPLYWELRNLLSFMKKAKAVSQVRCLDVSILAAASVIPRSAEAEFTWIDLQMDLLSDVQPCSQVRELHLGYATAVGCMLCIPQVFPQVEEIYIRFDCDDATLLANLNWLKHEKPYVKIHLIDASLEMIGRDFAGSKSKLLIETVRDLIRAMNQDLVSVQTASLTLPSIVMVEFNHDLPMIQQTIIRGVRQLGFLIVHLDLSFITPMQAFNIIPQACPNVKTYALSDLRHGKTENEMFTFTSMKNLLALELSERIFPIISLEDLQKVLDVCHVLTKLIFRPMKVFNFESVPLEIALPRSLQVFSLRYSQVHESKKILAEKLLQATLQCPSLGKMNTDSAAAFKLLGNTSFPGAWGSLFALFLQNNGTPGGSETLAVLRRLSDCYAPLRFLKIHHIMQGTNKKELIEVLRNFHQLETLILSVTFDDDITASDWRDIKLHVPGLRKLSFSMNKSPHDESSRIDYWTAVFSALAEFRFLHTLDVSFTRVDDASDLEVAEKQLVQVIKKLHGKWLTKFYSRSSIGGACIVAHMCPATYRVG